MKYKLDDTKIKALLLDSGWVLNRPVNGHWFIPPNFFNYVDEKAFKLLDRKQRNNAFYKAGNYISKQALIVDTQEELVHFLEYYKIFSKELPQLGLTNQHIKAIAEDLVFNCNKYGFYQDVVLMIPELCKKYKLAVVSDAWPSLENVFIKSGLRDHFSSFIISSAMGITKPHELMYKAALEELNVSPAEAIFIDDNIKNCKGAEAVGIQSILLCRDWKLYLYHKLSSRNFRVIRNLYEIK